MDTTTIIVIAILVIALLFFGYTILKPNTSGTTGTGQVTSFPQQQAIGGGCGR